MKTSHTPGPWKSERLINPPKAKDRRCGFVVNGPDAQPLPIRICDLRVPSGVGGFSEGEANARLIAAAPDLLAALELCERALTPSRTDAGLIAADEARAAIAKTRG